MLPRTRGAEARILLRCGPIRRITVNLIAADGTGEKTNSCARPASRSRWHSPDTHAPYSGHSVIRPILRDDRPISAAERSTIDNIVELLCRDFGYSCSAARPARKANGAAHSPRAAGDWQQPPTTFMPAMNCMPTRDLAAKMVRSGMDGGASSIPARIDEQLGGSAR